MKDKLPPHRFGPGYDVLGNRGAESRVLGSGKASYMNDRTTHSVGIRPHPHNRAIARDLLNIAKVEKTVAGPTGIDKVFLENFVTDKRPLIDKLHEATFHDTVGLQWIADKYALRMLVRKTHCFTLNAETSSLIADFSVAIAHNLDAARQLAIPPFPVTWIDIDNTARLKRLKEIGVRLTKTAAGESEAGAAVERVGWLVFPAEFGGHYVLYVTEVDQGIIMAPLAYYWHDGAHTVVESEDIDEFIEMLTFGVKNTGVGSADAYPTTTPLHIDILKKDRKGVYSEQIRGLMTELAGELRHVLAFLIALGCSDQGTTAQVVDQPKHTDIRKAPNGKPLLPIEHKLLHIHLRKKQTPIKAVTRLITKHKMREHDVRAHWRTLLNEDGSVRARIPIKSHVRGDRQLGRIEKTYKVEK
jgi:hypothetical protein